MATMRSTSQSTTAPVKTTATAKTATPVQPTQTAHSAVQATKPACEHVAKRAYEKWMKRGCVHGYDVQDWMEAEKEVMAEQGRSSTTAAKPAATRR